MKKVKGRTLPLMVPTNVTAGELLKAATAKHSRHFTQFNQLESYFLLYPDQTVVDTLLGSAEPFILNQYKEELGKPFSKVYFWFFQQGINWEAHHVFPCYAYNVQEVLQ